MHLGLIVTLVSSSLVAAVPQFNGHQSHVTEPLPVGQYQRSPAQTQSSPSLWTRARDSVIESIWGIPKRPDNGGGNKLPSLKPTAPSSLRARYGEDVVLRFSIKDGKDVEALVEASNILFLDVWSSTNEWVDIRLAKDVVPSLLGLLPDSLQTSHVPLMHDLTQAIYESYPSTHSPEQSDHDRFSPSTGHSSGMKNVFFEDYQPLSVIRPWMRLLASLFSSHVRLISVGTTAEGREIPALRIGVHPTNSEKQAIRRRTIVISGGSHAREWISVSTVNYVAYSLITGYGKSKPITKLLEEFDFVFIPTTNPDGYVYTWETDRLWRKNRQETSLQFCPGIDIDRSWDFKWGGQPNENNPCSENFAGETPFEAVESKAIAEWAKNEVANNNVEIVAFLDLHSYSQQVLYPYAYSCDAAPPGLENMQELALGIVKSIHRSYREFYYVSSACEANVMSDEDKAGKKAFPQMESSGGTALDWFYHELGVPYAYQIKLRDRGSYGFLLPKENIVPTGKEILNAVVTMGKFLIRNEVEWMEWDSEPFASNDGSPNGGEMAGAEGAVLKTQGGHYSDGIGTRSNDAESEDDWKYTNRR